MFEKKVASLEEDLTVLLDRSREVDTLTLNEILNILSTKGRLLILIFLSLPFCQPIQIPGFSIPFGIAVAFFALRIAFGKRFWLPQTVMAKSLQAKTVEKIAKKSLDLLKKIRPLIRPRVQWVCTHRGMQLVNGLLLFFLGIFLALPLPIPFSNIVAGWAILLVSLGLLENDGLFVLAGYVLSAVIAIFLIFLLFSLKTFFKTH